MKKNFIIFHDTFILHEKHILQDDREKSIDIIYLLHYIQIYARVGSRSHYTTSFASGVTGPASHKCINLDIMQ